MNKKKTETPVVQPTPEAGTYIYKGLTFTLKKRNLKLRRDSFALIKKFLDFSKSYTENSKQNQIQFEKNPESKEYKYWTAEVNADTSLAVQSFIMEEDNLKEIFSKCIDGEVNKINYDCETDNDYIELMSFGTQVLNDFFGIYGMAKKNQIK